MLSFVPTALISRNSNCGYQDISSYLVVGLVTLATRGPLFGRQEGQNRDCFHRESSLSHRFHTRGVL
ncbi:hypothetical protein CEXT_441621 [Caerostris extrusa]|uniref:Uncharacterized protein n=1 Tax=Caerostris extrusa TaxID=172846 RepID=A0AAV4XA82_CAEEX|nr:hypothetical protein CEXT_441621 [Caerostris extrusa]